MIFVYICIPYKLHSCMGLTNIIIDCIKISSSDAPHLHARFASKNVSKPENIDILTH